MSKKLRKSNISSTKSVFPTGTKKVEYVAGSGFFSYRIFERWQCAVEKLVYGCNSLYEIHRLNKLIEYEFTHYPYPVEIEAAINETIEACATQLIELVSYGNHHLVAS
jgi:hypothetical protein